MRTDLNNATMADNYMYTSIADIQKLLKGNTNSQSLAMLNNVMAETIGMSMHNAVTAQHNAQMLNSATTTSTCTRILSVLAAKVPPPPPPPPPPVPPAPVPPAPAPPAPAPPAPAPPAPVPPAPAPPAPDA